MTDTTDSTATDRSRTDSPESGGDAAAHARSDGTGAPRTDVETAVPPGVDAFECERCGRPFESERNLALHRGLAHEEALSEAERAAFVEGYEAESAELDRFRIVALGALVLLYFGLLFAYAVFA